MTIFKQLHIHNRFFSYIAVLSGVFLLSYWISILLVVAWFLAITFTTIALIDIVLLFRFKNGITANRVVPEKFSNSDENKVSITLNNQYPFAIKLTTIDELPIQFQKRDFVHFKSLEKHAAETFDYTVTPFERGEYHFGSLNVFAATALSFFSRRFRFDADKMVAVYPSYIQMKKYEFLAISNKLNAIGLKKIRRIGHTLEFEQIKNYVVGDDVRTINWKATAKKGELMLNQYQDEKSQPIYSIIDTGRVMKMPFNELKLLDYAINATLAFSNIALLKNDKAGMLTFSKSVNNLVLASNKKTNLSVINETLYNINTEYSDSDFGLLYGTIKRKINQRSLLILYTNFEHISSLKRQLPFLLALSKKHLLITVFFENTELDELIKNNANDLQEVYHKTIAEKFSYDKRLIAKELESKGVNTILTKPELLSVNVINKYLEFKSKGLI
ncbi:DUF58 domain-containing protein [Polaribacter uvawellassae]|uniref:DUF58 domain-containing protein n=1 Tax=Polaribacter uvawellassae TaxID=3133495 RepID=UPI003219043D